MISKKRRHKKILFSATPTTGRAAFRGILHPLILGGQSIAPSSTATTSNFDPYSSATVTQPDKDPQPTSTQTACELPLVEQEYCDVNPNFSWCEKRKLKSDDPKCAPVDIKCPMTQEWLDSYHSTDVNDQFGLIQKFLANDGILNGVNGQCIDDYKRTRQKCARIYYDFDDVVNRNFKKGDLYATFCPIQTDKSKRFVEGAEQDKGIFRVEYFYP